MNPIGAIVLMVIRLALLGIAGRRLLAALDAPRGPRRRRRIVFASAVILGTTMQL